TVLSHYLARSYVALTRGNARSNMTATAGVVATNSNNMTTQVSPMLAYAFQLGLFDHFAVIYEYQYFLRPYEDVKSTFVFAFRAQGESRRGRMRMDLGTLVLEDSKDEHFFPWLQVGF